MLMLAPTLMIVWLGLALTTMCCDPALFPTSWMTTWSPWTAFGSSVRVTGLPVGAATKYWS
jgi:hypothetical protein